MNNKKNLKKSIADLKEFWSNHDDYDIREKAREYIDLYNSNGNSDHFSFVHPEDEPYIKTDGCNAVRWGIPNQVLGDIEKAKFIFGLYNPGTQMKTGIGNKCKNINEYVEEEQKEEDNTGTVSVNFDSKEYSDDSNFYLEHVISDENIMSQELKKLYKVFKGNWGAVQKENGDYDSKVVKKIAYYLSAYYSKVFMDNGPKNGFQNSMIYYCNLFEKMERAKVIVKENSLNYDVEKAFNQAVENIAICNVEMVPYRSNMKGDIKKSKKKELVDLPSTSIVANLIVEKLIVDTDTIAIFRSFSPEKKTGWRYVLERNAEEQGINFKENIKPALYHFSGQNAAFSKNNIKAYDTSAQNSQKKVDAAINTLLEELKIQPFVDELDEIIANNK